MLSTRKIAIKTAKPVKVECGQHSLAVGPQEVCGTKQEILHLPLRSRAEILKRGLEEPRWAKVRKDRSMTWQSTFFYEAATNGKLDAVWAAHSCDSSEPDRRFTASRSWRRKITGFDEPWSEQAGVA